MGDEVYRVSRARALVSFPLLAVDARHLVTPRRWEGVMADGSLSAFVNHYINEQPEIPPLPSKFSIVVANPADMGSRGGVIVEQLEEYDQYDFLIR